MLPRLTLRVLTQVPQPWGGARRERSEPPPLRMTLYDGVIYLFAFIYAWPALAFLKPLDYKQVFHRRSCSCRTTFGFLTAVSSSKEISPPILHQCTALTLTASPPFLPLPFPPFCSPPIWGEAGFEDQVPSIVLQPAQPLARAHSLV